VNPEKPTAANPAASSFCKPAQSAPATGSSVSPEKPTPANPPGSSFCETPESPLAKIEAQLRRKEKQFEAFRDGSSFCKPPAPTPRNALCPCGSGAKYKRCCGKNAPPVLNTAGRI
jgi:hypothetical protein